MRRKQGGSEKEAGRKCRGGETDVRRKCFFAITILLLLLLLILTTTTTTTYTYYYYNYYYHYYYLYLLLLLPLLTTYYLLLLPRGGNLLAPYDSIRFRFRGQRFDSKPIIDASRCISFFYVHFHVHSSSSHQKRTKRNLKGQRATRAKHHHATTAVAQPIYRHR